MELELYLHIPFCEKKCAYCDFLSAPADHATRQAYVDRLMEEIMFYSNQYSEAEVTSIFVGGGTPTILEGRYLARILNFVCQNFHVRSNAEITLECNPGTLTQEKAVVLSHAGYNRISIGLQSADNIELAMLGRIHTYPRFLESFEMARKAGFENINVDLMSALPGQTVQSWEQTLRKVVSLQPEHISAYSLIIEEGTPFYRIYHEEDEARSRGEATTLLPSEDAEREMYRLTEEILRERHYYRYEISNYSKPGYECIHNIGYWTRKNYLGLGLGSSSMIDNMRFQNTSDLDKYMTGKFHHQNLQKIDWQGQMEEYMFLGLRLTAGISAADFVRKFGVSLESVYGETIQKLSGQNLICYSDGQLYLTELGIDVSNMVLAEFLL